MSLSSASAVFFFFNDTATTEIYTLSLHDALPISGSTRAHGGHLHSARRCAGRTIETLHQRQNRPALSDRKSTRLNSSHDQISYAVFCLKKKNYAELVRPRWPLTPCSLLLTVVPGV